VFDIPAYEKLRISAEDYTRDKYLTTVGMIRNNHAKTPLSFLNRLYKTNGQ